MSKFGRKQVANYVFWLLLLLSPLVLAVEQGQIWSAAQQRFVSQAELVRDLAQHPYVLLGEIHDNPDHHLLQALLIHEVLKTSQGYAVAFEMLDLEQQPALDALLEQGAVSVKTFHEAINIAELGWDWELYQPVFQVALAQRLDMQAVNLSRQRAAKVVKQGLEALSTAEVTNWGLDAAFPEAWQQQVQAQIAESHCGYLPESVLPKMQLAQLSRDAAMAFRLSELDKAILIAGRGHTDTQFGVPVHLQRKGLDSVSVAFVELQPDTALADYALNADYWWFTAEVADREDPCEQFAQFMQRKAQQQTQASETRGE